MSEERISIPIERVINLEEENNALRAQLEKINEITQLTIESQNVDGLSTLEFAHLILAEIAKSGNSNT